MKYLPTVTRAEYRGEADIAPETLYEEAKKNAAA